MAVIPSLPPYPTSTISAEKYTSGGEYILSTTRKDYIGYYFEILGRRTYYTGKSPGAPDSPSPADPTITPNIPLLSYSSQGIVPAGGKFIPPSYSPVPTIQNYQNTIIARFFARDLTKKEYREISYSSYTNINNKSPDWDFKNWEVKSIFTGWYINNYIENLYLFNKGSIWDLDQGNIVPPSSTISTGTLVAGLSATDTNPPTPWPGFKEWFVSNTGGYWVEKYYSSVPKTVSKISSNYNSFEDPNFTYDKDMPTIKGFQSRAYTLRIAGGNNADDFKAFTQFHEEIEEDVYIDRNTQLLTTVLKSKGEHFYRPDKDKGTKYIYRSNLSEVFLPNSLNPNSPLTLNRPKLAFKVDGEIYPTGPFCKTQLGMYFAGNLPPTTPINPAVNYWDKTNRELIEILEAPTPITDTDNGVIHEAFVLLPNSQTFNQPPYYTTTTSYVGLYTIPQEFSSNSQYPKFYTELPYVKGKSIQIRKIFYKYVTKDQGWFLQSNWAAINTSMKNNQTPSDDLLYEGWIHYFDYKTNEPPFSVSKYDVTKTPISQNSFILNQPPSPTNDWGIRTNILPSSENKKVLRISQSVGFTG